MKKKFALLTGASSGIGWEMALQLAERGYSLVLVARRESRLHDLKKKIQDLHPVEIFIIISDLSEPNSALELFAQTKILGIKIDILINNAAVGMGGEFLEASPSELEKMFRLNIHSLTLLCRLFGEEMQKEKKGHILNVASASAFLPSAYVAAYAATKAYVFSFSEALWYEMKPLGVSVTTLYPGITETEFYAAGHTKPPPIMKFSILSASRVANIGLRAMFNRKRSIVPGLINKINAFLCHVLPRAWVIRSAGFLLKKANT